MYSSHEAFRLLNEWKKQRATIRLLLTLSFGAGSFTARVAAVEGTSVHLLSPDKSLDFLLSLVAACFEYRAESDQSELAVSDDYKCSLIATFPSRAKIVFSELP
jgi:hypothetical protein